MAWDRWSSTNLSRPEPDDPTERKVAWPPHGEQLVHPFLVNAAVIGDDEVTTIDFRLYYWDGTTFHYSHDRLVALIDRASPAHLELCDVVIDSPVLRGQGRGSVLLRALESLCEDCGVRWIEGGISPRDDMPRLVRFYLRRGFTVTESDSAGLFAWRIRKDLGTDSA